MRVKLGRKEEEEKKIILLGKRNRKQFINVDNMTDQQYFQALENHQDPHEFMIQESLKKKTGNDSRDYGSEEGGDTTSRRLREESEASKLRPVEDDGELRNLDQP